MPRSRGHCVIEDCKNHNRIGILIARGLCPTCYSRWKRGTVVLPFTGDETSICGNPECGRVFEQDQNKARQYYCSEKCRNRAQKLRSRTYARQRAGNDDRVVALERQSRAIGHPYGLENDPWAGDLHAVGAFGLPVPMSTSVQPWGMS